MAKTKYRVKFKQMDKKTGRVTNSGRIQDVQAESETNAIAQIKKQHSTTEVEIISVTSR
jgi:hypothetical protein